MIAFTGSEDFAPSAPAPWPVDASPASLRILHVIHSTNPAGGGPVEVIRQLSQVHQRDGHASEVLCLDEPAAPWLADFPLPCHALGPASRGYGYTSRLVPWLRSHAESYDVIVGHGLWQYVGLALQRALGERRTPYFVFTHGMLDPWFKRRYPLKHLKKWLYWRAAEHQVLRGAAAVLFTCEEERRLARDSFRPYRCVERVVHLGISGPPEAVQAEQSAFCAAFPQLRSLRLLLFLGRIHEKKGCGELLRGFQRALAASPTGTMDLHLVMAGPLQPGYGSALREQAERLGLADRVTWTGMLAGPLKWGAFRAADAFVLPSHQENFGLAVAEALACGVPVLISEKVNIWREIAEDRAGLVEPDGLAGTARLLERWLALESDARDEMRAAARACFLRRFEVEQAARGLIDVLREAAGIHSSPRRPGPPLLPTT